ncbi:hypothetical protein DN069_34675 [Streptacidiphilus pinicola]|uniref:DinB-like domain-containing protein n=1 Tax=Streptacidiphilus pinicola TaxID=2219663 RepID=A0A2X0J170_9ACTN|nr:DUF664 domain-containing protein [Streptacidiphilus pinicola]RAG81098.1 hypothetical protein DN069_34675 [Streptacidiphilus pinicola]
MTVATELLSDAFVRVKEIVHEAAADLTPEQLAFQPDPAANSIAWLVWHLTRVQDDHVSELAEKPQAWTDLGWRERFALPFGPGATGYGQNAGQVASLEGVDAERLLGYHDDVHARTVAFLSGSGGHHLDRVVDASWDPPVTAAVRLVSVVSDDLQHAGQAAYVRGLLERAR